MSESTDYNRLKDEASSYLKQHENNPVHWWAWGPEALQKSKDENKPIFLSIGYSSCHWCHVMAHESFQDQETAEQLNENFICIKVDKEEWPDIDNYYQQACQLFTRSGGWPLSAFLLPDLRPYFVGTYFPLVASGEQTSFKDLLTELTRAFNEETKQVEENAANVTKAIAEGLVNQEKVQFEGHFPAPSAVLEAINQFEDKDHGGYGAAPKFPQFSFYEWAVEQMLEGMVEQSRGEHIIKSVEKMLMGGVFDQARGGIHRYSTDEKWLVPHFEKMLYDQAGALRLLSKISMLYPSPLVYDHIMNTLDYLEAEMLGEDGQFFAAQDADSEGTEGLYFCFSEEEFEDLVNKIDDEDDLSGKMEDIKSWFGITKEGNFDHGLNVVSLNWEKREQIFTTESWDLVRKIRKSMLNERKNRIPPFTDTKGIASWNFMLISSLVDVMQYCKIDVIRQMASSLFNRALEGSYKNFIVSKDENKMSLRHSTTKNVSLPYLEDYVFFCETQLRTYEITGNPVFRDNFQDTLDFVYKEFIEGDQLLTRGKSATDFELYPNQKHSSYDSSFKSPVSTLISLSRRAALLFSDPELLEPVKPLIEVVKQQVLVNPLGAGEGLRALTYPEEAYRVIKLPKKWLENSDFLGFIPYFLPRFVLSYTEEDSEQWQICGIKSCELQGEGLDSFIETLTPAQKEPEAENKSE
ncbi:MAG: thioredoxin domain-containing protein [Bacteriovoracaceae bacterium]|nr:thioredoxin domain-containing protein [Bacteriovoracaceae bacterium]